MNFKIALGATLLLAPLVLPLVSHAGPRKKASSKAKTPTNKIVWRTDLAVALKESRKSGKPIFIDVYTDWCGPCKMLDDTVYRDKAFIKESREWIMVKINPEKSSAGAKVAEKYKVTGFPTLIFTDSSGKQVHSFSGASSAPWKTWLGPEIAKAKKKIGVLSVRNFRNVSSVS